ncbi:MAG: hypothetical protein HY868_03325 [Chloroflexi bacterium]|nr:hypothetical protein [Chloroflexota bacterium]
MSLSMLRLNRTNDKRASPRAELTQLVLPSYDVPELIVIGGVIVENRGDDAAHNVKIVIEFDDARAEKIRHLQVISDAEYILLSGGDEKSFATLRMRELAAQQRVVIYFSGPDRLAPRVTVTHYEG